MNVGNDADATDAVVAAAAAAEGDSSGGFDALGWPTSRGVRASSAHADDRMFASAVADKERDVPNIPEKKALDACSIEGSGERVALA